MGCCRYQCGTFVIALRIRAQHYASTARIFVSNLQGLPIRILEDPIVLSAVLAALLPLLTAGILTGCIGGMIGVRSAGSAIALAFVIAHLSILGWPPLPPGSSLQKIVYIALIGLFLGVALDFLIDRAPIKPVALIWPGVIIAWLGWQQLLGLEVLDLARLVLVWFAGGFIFDRLLAFRTAEIIAPTMVLVAGIGMSAIAMIGTAASLSQLAAAVAAATGGFLLWNWPRQRYPFSIAALYGAASALFGVGAATVLFTRASSLALAILLLVFVVGSIRDRLPLTDGPVWGPISFGIIVTIPMLLAIAVAFFVAPGSTNY